MQEGLKKFFEFFWKIRKKSFSIGADALTKLFFCIIISLYIYLMIEVNVMKFINIGFGNMVAVDRMVALVSPDSAPIKRLIQDAKDSGRTIDVTCGRRTRAVIITDSEHVILSAIQAETIANRLENDALEDDNADEEADDE